jgi:hypothetical protein
MLADLIGQVKALDMDDVRAQMEAQEAEEVSEEASETV